MLCFLFEIHIYRLGLEGPDILKNLLELYLKTEMAKWSTTTEFFVDQNIWIPSKKWSQQITTKHGKELNYDEFIAAMAEEVKEINAGLTVDDVPFKPYSFKAFKAWLTKFASENQNKTDAKTLKLYRIKTVN